MTPHLAARALAHAGPLNTNAGGPSEADERIEAFAWRCYGAGYSYGAAARYARAVYAETGRLPRSAAEFAADAAQTKRAA